MIDTKMYKIKLEREMTLVQEELKEIATQNPDGTWEAVETEVDSDHADENDVASNLESFSDNQSTMVPLATRYENIRAALARIDAGTYGICEVCGIEIPEERLQANPSARTCIEHTK